MENIEKFDGFACNADYDFGSGDGYGSGSGECYGSGAGYGSIEDSGAGSGYDDGSGYGSGHGTGYGDGSGAGYGSGSVEKNITQFCGEKVYTIDGIPTIIRRVHGNVAAGIILRKDFTTERCFIAKNGSVFAHGRTLHEAMDALREKQFDGMSVEERIKAFVTEFPEADKHYPNEALFAWHHRLTGSCLMGREEFIRERGITLDGKTTVREFIRLTQNAYGGSVIGRLKERYGISHEADII